MDPSIPVSQTKSTPTTPSNQHASLSSVPSRMSRSRSSSPPTEQTSSFPAVARDSASHLQSPSRAERLGYMSPLPPSSSMTPPPSSQIPPRSLSPSSSPPRQSNSVVGGISALPSSLASPPATVQPPQRDSRPVTLQNATSDILPALDQPMITSSPTELQAALRASSSKVIELTNLLNEARMSAAHYKLQHNLLTIETEEAAKRMEVEHEMTKREVEILRFRQHQSGDTQHASGAYMPNIRQLNSELEQHCQNLEQNADLLRHRLRQAKKLILLRNGEVQMLTEQNEMLRKRIRDNREHLNQLRRPGGLYDPNPPRQTETAPVTPQRSAVKPTGASRHGHMSSGQEGRQDTFAALLLADQVLSQETTSAPSTPTRNRPSKPRYHSRDHHSLSSLHSTPRQSQLASSNNNNNNNNNGLLPPVSLQSTSKTPSKKQVEDAPRQKRRESRDSTISASEKGGDTSDEDAVSEPAASRLATSLLRRSPGQTIEVIPTPSPRSTGLLQGKLFGRVLKPGVDRSPISLKRKGEIGGDGEKDPKRMKTNQAIGLGIGGWGSPSS